MANGFNTSNTPLGASTKPAFSSLSQFTLVETEEQQDVYVIGGDAAGQHFRILQASSTAVKEHNCTYTAAGVRQFIGTLKVVTKVTFSALLGIVRLPTLCLLFVNEKRDVGRLRSHAVFAVEQICLYPLFSGSSTRKLSQDEEQRKGLLLGLFRNDFYFSHSSDLSRTVQHNFETAFTDKNSPNVNNVEQQSMPELPTPKIEDEVRLESLDGEEGTLLGWIESVDPTEDMLVEDYSKSKATTTNNRFQVSSSFGKGLDKPASDVKSVAQAATSTISSVSTRTDSKYRETWRQLGTTLTFEDCLTDPSYADLPKSNSGLTRSDSASKVPKSKSFESRRSSTEDKNAPDKTVLSSTNNAPSVRTSISAQSVTKTPEKRTETKNPSTPSSSSSPFSLKALFSPLLPTSPSKQTAESKQQPPVTPKSKSKQTSISSSVDCIPDSEALSTTTTKSKAMCFDSQWIANWSPAQEFLALCGKQKASFWLTPVIHGYFSQKVFENGLTLTVLARRSRLNWNFSQVGSSDISVQGGNHVEIEQIIEHPQKGICSIVLSRDAASNILAADSKQPSKTAASYFSNYFVSRFGSPAIVLNLMQTKDKTSLEAELAAKLAAAVTNCQELHSSSMVSHVSYDWNRHNRKHTTEQDMLIISSHLVRGVGLFSCDEHKLCKQQGRILVTCGDGRLRAGLATEALAKWTLKQQFQRLGLLDGRQAIMLFAQVAEALPALCRSLEAKLDVHSLQQSNGQTDAKTVDLDKLRQAADDTKQAEASTTVNKHAQTSSSNANYDHLAALELLFNRPAPAQTQYPWLHPIIPGFPEDESSKPAHIETFALSDASSNSVTAIANNTNNSTVTSVSPTKESVANEANSIPSAASPATEVALLERLCKKHPAILFVLTSNLDASLVIYEAQLDKSKQIDPRCPLRIFWLKADTKQPGLFKREPLTLYERSYSFGAQFAPVSLEAKKKEFQFSIPVLKNCLLYVSMNESGPEVNFLTQKGSRAQLLRLTIFYRKIIKNVVCIDAFYKSQDKILAERHLT